jgi:hypothetical protein
MIQGRIRLFGSLVALAATLAVAVDASGQSAARSRRVAQPVNGPNVTGETDAAAGNFVDSLFTPFAPADPLDGAASRALGVPQTAKSGLRPTWSARLVRNPHPEDGNPPFALIDRYGGIQRYVEPVASVDLEQHVGSAVAVRRDTGGTLLASQLDLPRTAPRRATPRPYTNLDNGVRLAAQEVPMMPPVPTPADEGMTPTPMAEGDAEMGGMGDTLPAPEEMAEGMMEGEIVEGEIIDGGMMHEGHYDGETYYEGMGEPLMLDGDSELHLNGCLTCGDAICGGQGCNNPCGLGSRPIFYARGEYLNWWFDGMQIPPLVVNAGVNDDTTPPVPEPPVAIVFGGTDVLDDDRSGGRITLGYFFDDYGKWGIEGDYISFGEENLSFTDGGDGVTTYVGRPYIDATTGLPAVEDVALVDVITGDVTVNIDSTFQSAGVRFRRNLCCIAGGNVGCGDCVSCGTGVSAGGCSTCGDRPGAACPVCPLVKSKIGRFINSGTRHVDVLYGFRWAELDEGLRVNEDLVADDETTFVIDDVFDTNNRFICGEIGFLVDWQRRRWSFEFLSKLALGTTRQRVSITGQTIQDGVAFADIGLLAQPSNVGTYERDEFSVLPEIGATVGYMLTERLRVTAGYTLLYWSRVARPGDQIDLRVNPDFLDLVDGDPSDTAADAALIDPQSPEFVFRDTDIWAHGFNAGIDYRW